MKLRISSIAALALIPGFSAVDDGYAQESRLALSALTPASAAIAISGAAPLWMAAACVSVRGRIRAK